MVKATSIDMALSDIISHKKKSTKKGVKKPIRKVGGGIAKRGNAGTPRRQSGGAPRRQSGGGRDQGRGTQKVVRKSHGGGAGSNEQRSVRINISNLAGTVLSSDLQELFGKYNLRKVSVNFNEDGTPAGTGDLTLSKLNADRLIQKFAGVALDEKVMHFAVIEYNNNIVARAPEARGTPNRRNSTVQSNGRPSKKFAAKLPRNKTAARPPATSAKKPKREPKPQKTAEELDAELDAYMSRS